MARGKKAEQVLTLEEKLKQALVPEDEQPYSIPENWCWTYIGHCYAVTSSKRVHKEDWKDSGIPFYRTRELVKLSQNGYVDNELFISNGLYEKLVADYGKPKIGDILISGVGTIGVPFIVKENTPFYFKDGNIIWFQCKGICLPEYIFYLYKSNYMSNLIHDMSAGTTVDTYTIINANKTVFPFPPLTEQKRIVFRIESLFSKLDEAKEKVQAVVDGFELRKSAILHKAFTGELTVQWRKTNEVELESWESVQWGDLITSIKAGKNWLAEGHPPNNDEFGVVKVSAVTWGEFDEQESKTCTTPSQWNEAVQIKTGDFLFSRANTLQLVGNCVIVEDISKRLMLSDKILKLTFSEKIIPWFVLYFTNSKLYRVQIEDLSSGNQDGMRNVSQKNLKLVELLLPRLQEQKEIVRILDNFFAKEKQAKQAAESVLTQIDYIKKSILSRAFRGELGTNDPAEESAEELLKTVL